MKTFLLTFSCALLSFTASYAQITLNNASYTATYAGTTDSVSIAYGSLPALASGANATWNLSTISYTVVDTPYMMHNAGPLSFLYADYFHHVISGNLYFNTRPYFNIDSTGFKQYGETIDRRSYGLYGAIPGANNTDSIIFAQQTDVYTSPLTKVKFPATYNSNWSSSYRSDVNFTITYSVVYNNAPGIYRSLITEYDTVIGWGKMKVKKADGTASGSMDVLQVKVNYQQMDSFYIAGSPASSTLLGQFGLTQGNITTSYEYRYIRPNEVTPLVDVYFVNSNYSNTNVNKTIVHQQRLSQTDTSSLVQNIANNDAVFIYPNPVSKHTLFVNTGAGNTKWSYQLINALGQNISTGTLSSASGENTIQIPEGTAAGMYYLRLNDNKEIYVKPVNIIR